MRQVDLMKRITANPRILGGKPIIRGTRISVEFILELLASGATEPEILQDYPHLKSNDIMACLQYAARSSQNEIYVDLEKVG
ncbi:hypothetical protein CLG94_04845 [Candidatus Methylomirabilis limnetica]|uniref:Antitoxin n=1 Tax=Candidatus Methylomirabilis limnetica TaxID=2033718 RepID=A0A2T4TZ20_9BACT|nr:DUF433 domain-containing protein [Candidatus Methylomirabilis limnetica]PTL36363.1 hypothetical protein CLG94_04845 [Candidatus Methylomirabilis limnetica]